MKILEIEERLKTIRVRVDNEDDLWELYNILYTGDTLIARTTREIKTNDSSYRRSITVAIKIEWAEMQPMSNRLRVHGIVIDCPDDIEIKGKHHTVNIDTGSAVTLIKEQSWNTPDLKRLKEAEKRTSINLIIISIDNEEVAVSKVTNSGSTVLMQKSIDLRVKGHPEGNEGNKDSIIEGIVDEVLVIMRRQRPDFVAVAGPSMTKGDFLKMLRQKFKDKEIISVDTSYGGLAGVNEALKRDTLSQAIKNLQVIEEISIMEEFNSRISKNLPVGYGLDDVEKAASIGAIEYLFVHSKMLNDQQTRERVIRIMENAERKGARIKIFTADDNAKAWLKSFGGIAAFLRFSIQ